MAEDRYNERNEDQEQVSNDDVVGKAAEDSEEFDEVDEYDDDQDQDDAIDE